MAKLCPHCGGDITPRPVMKIVKGKKKIIWINLLLPDLIGTMLIISVLLLVYGYVHDTDYCMTIIERPCDYVEEFNCNPNPWDDDYSNNNFDILLPGSDDGG